MSKRFLILMMVLFVLPVCFADEVIEIGLTKDVVSTHEVSYTNNSIIYNPPDGYEIESVTFEAHWEVVNYNGSYWYMVYVDGSPSIDGNLAETVSSITKSWDVTTKVLNSSGSINTDIELKFGDSTTSGFDVPTCTAKFIVKLKPKTVANTTVKAPIPPIAILLTLIAIPIVVLRKLK